MADEAQDDRGPDLAAIATAIRDDPQPAVAPDRIAEAVASEPASVAGKQKPRAVGAKRTKPARPSFPAAAAAEEPSEEPKLAADPETIPSISEEQAMADETLNTTATATPAADTMQAFYDRSNGLASDMSELGRGNVEALVESTRILAAGLQDIGRTTLEETRTVYESMTDDVKRMAAAKSPTELMQLQSDLARRNVDTFITQTSKNAEIMLKLVNDMFAPVSSRMSVTMEKLSKAA